ncbi:DUF5018 domain-containing protein [uncultured Alistipes sp.]|jgi:hypothetical protein|uniref:DUF5018 domain-containing protein n=1 Tax=uncultured Alistipes sp. TaxID=538949 RepID=UPI0025F489E7|nr:DUF5018 domain-containing protein [uncultured Alistipes sp.]
MKNSFKLFALAALLTAGGCHEPDELTPSVVDQGLNSISAQFATGEYKNDAQAKFSAAISDPDQERIVIDIPYYYPESSTSLTSITQMRVTASIDDNCSISPALGTLDLTKENWFTLTRADGSKKKYCITGQIKKSDKCQIISFSIDDPALTGVIDQSAKTISLISIEDLSSATATAILSPHASISPDPTVAANYEGDGAKFTVTAHDGETKAVYTVSKQIPPKVKYGWRVGSQTAVWLKNVNTEYGIVNAANMNHTLAIMGSELILSSGATQYRINAITGARIGEIAGHMDLEGGAITSDKAGHLLMCKQTAKGAVLKIYMTSSPQTAPTEFISWTYNIGVGVKMGAKISVQGDITKNAIITIPTWAWANPPTHREFIRWIVTDGVVGAPEAVQYTGGTAYNSGNTDVVYASATAGTGNYFVTSYGGAGNKLDAIDAVTNACLKTLATPTWGANSNFNTVDAIEFNNATYVAVYGGMHFTYSQCLAYMHDVTTLDQFTGTIQDSPCCVWNSGQDPLEKLTTFASSDIIMAASPDGYQLNLFYVDGNTRTLAAWQFDCIDK